MDGNPSLRAELLAEFLGTFVLILFGTGVVAMVVLFPSRIQGRRSMETTPTLRSVGASG